jgi:hypothetical protein
MQKLLSWRAWALVATLLFALIPAAALAAPPAQGTSYNASVTASETNCGLTQIVGVVKDEAGNHLTGVKVRVWVPGTSYNNTTVSGNYVRPDTGASGWDMFIDNRPKPGDWHVAAVNDNGDLL